MHKFAHCGCGRQRQEAVVYSPDRVRRRTGNMMPNSEQSIGAQTARQSALSKELIGILAVGATLLVGQVSAFSSLRADIADVRGELAGLRDETRADIGSLRDEMYAGIDGLRDEIRIGIGSLRDEMTADFGSLRDETRTGIGSLRDEMAADFGSLRDEMRTEFGDLRTEISGLRQDTNAEMGSVHEEMAGLRERMARVETHLVIIREDVAYLSGRRDSPAQPQTDP